VYLCERVSYIHKHKSKQREREQEQEQEHAREVVSERKCAERERDERPHERETDTEGRRQRERKREREKHRDRQRERERERERERASDNEKEKDRDGKTEREEIERDTGVSKGCLERECIIRGAGTCEQTRADAQVILAANQHAQRQSFKVVCPQTREGMQCSVGSRAKTRWHCEPSHTQCKSEGFLPTVACGQVAPSVARLKPLPAAPWPEVQRLTAARGSARRRRLEFSYTRCAGAGTP